MSIQSITGSSVAARSSNEAPLLPQKTLGQDDFLKLLVAQLTAQDPLNPVKDTEFIAQMAQFTAVEQTRAMQAEMGRLRADQQFLQANQMIGRNVAFQTDPDSPTVTGTVTAAAIEAGTPIIAVDGQQYELSRLHSLTVTERQP